MGKSNKRKKLKAVNEVPAEHHLSLDQLQRVMPRNRRRDATLKMLDAVNSAIDVSADKEMYRDSVLGYISVMQDGKFKMPDYLNAVRYCSYKLMGDSQIAAYTKTFPDRYQHYLDNQLEDRHIAGVVSMYNKGQLVNKIIEQTLVPHHILNADMYQRALNVQVELMTGAKSETVRSNAADSILQHLKAPEAIEIDISIGLKEDDTIKELRDTTLELVAQQRAMLSAGAKTAKEIAHSKLAIIDVEVVEEDG